MHEAALAERLVKISLDAIKNHGELKVKSVCVSVGELAGVVPGALETAFCAFSAGTPLEGAGLIQELCPAVLACRSCGERYSPPSFPCRCPKCGFGGFDVVGGEDVFVKSVEALMPGEERK